MPHLIWLAPEIARCRPADPSACKVLSRCATFLADVPKGGAVKDWLCKGNANAMAGTVHCTGYRSLDSARKPAAPQPAVKQAIRGIA